MFKKQYFIGFLLAIFIFSIFLSPVSVSAQAQINVDPLSHLHKDFFDEVEYDGLKYKFEKDILPSSHKKRVAREPGKEFSVNIDSSETKYYLKIDFYSRSVFDDPNIVDPIMEVTYPNGRKDYLTLNRPEFYLTDFKKGKYKFKIIPIEKDYRYLFDIDLVDWDYQGKVAYVSNLNDWEKLDRFMSKGGKYVIASDLEVADKIGVAYIRKPFDGDKVGSNVLLRSLSADLDKVTIFNNFQNQVYESGIGSLAVAKPYKNSEVILLSPDLTTLSEEELGLVEEAVRDYISNKNNLFQYILVTLILFLLILAVYGGKKYRNEAREKIRKLYNFLEEIRACCKDGANKIIKWLFAFGLFLILLRLVFNFNIGFINYVVGKINSLLGLDSFRPIVFAGMSILLVLAAWFNWKSIFNFLVKNGERHYHKIELLLLLLVNVGIYNLLFNFLPEINRMLIITLLLLLVWLLLLKKKTPISNNDYSNLKKALLIILIIATPLKVLLITEPYWHFTDNWYKTFTYQAKEKNQSSSFPLKNITKEKKYSLTRKGIKTDHALEYSLRPDLAGRPDIIRSDWNISSSEPVYFKSLTGEGGYEYLISYPYYNKYRQVKSSDELTLLARKPLPKVVIEQKSQNSFEEIIKSFPKDWSLEVPGYITNDKKSLVSPQDGLIDLSQFYAEDLNIQNDLKKYDLSLIGARYNMFSYFEDSLRVDIARTDLNSKLGKDDSYLVIYGPENELIKIIHLDDDGKQLSAGPTSKTFSYRKDDLEKPGVYNLIFYDFSKEDVYLDSINLNSNLFVIENNPHINTDDYYQKKDSPYLATSKNSYFYPYERKILEPGNLADILLYPLFDQFTPSALGDLSSMDFRLFAQNRKSFTLHSFEIKYGY